MYDAAYAAIEAASDVRFTRFETSWQQPFFSGVIVARDETMESLQAHGYTVEQSRQVVSNLVDGQATALATGSIFTTAAIVFAAAASIVWLAPRPKHAVSAGHAH